MCEYDQVRVELGCQKSGAYMQRGLSKVSGNPLGAVDLLIFIVNGWVNTQTMQSRVIS